MTQVPSQMNYEIPPASRPAGLAIASMVLGIVSLLFCLWYIALPCGIVGLILGIIARKKAKRGEMSGEGFALAGIICSIIGLAIDAAMVGLVVVALLFARHMQVTPSSAPSSWMAPTTAPAASPTTGP